MLKLMIAAISICVSIGCKANYISGQYVLDTGKLVDLQNLEWLPLEHTSGISRVHIENGFIDNYGNEWNKGDWRYATKTEVSTLINSLWGGEFNGWSSNNASGALWFLSAFGGLSYDSGIGQERVRSSYTSFPWTGYDFSYFFYGSDQECINEPMYSCIGLIQKIDNSEYHMFGQNNSSPFPQVSYYPNSGPSGYFADEYGGDFLFSNSEDYLIKNFADPTMGSLLVRTKKSVNEPTGAFWITIFLLFFMHRKKQNKSRYSDVRYALIANGFNTK